MKTLITITLALVIGIIPNPPADEPIPPPHPAPIVIGTITPRYPYTTYLPIYHQP